jgi:hypothetical protein
MLVPLGSVYFPNFTCKPKTLNNYCHQNEYRRHFSFGRHVAIAYFRQGYLNLSNGTDVKFASKFCGPHFNYELIMYFLNVFVLNILYAFSILLLLKCNRPVRGVR